MAVQPTLLSLYLIFRGSQHQYKVQGTSPEPDFCLCFQIRPNSLASNPPSHYSYSATVIFFLCCFYLFDSLWGPSVDIAKDGPVLRKIIFDLESASL